MKQSMRILLTIAIVIVAIICGRWVWDHYLYSPWTRDGRVNAHVITIAPDVSGFVTDVNVKDNQQVQKGDELFKVDATRYEVKIHQLEATVENKLYSWELAKHRYERRKNLPSKQSISTEDLETARINTNIAKANYELAKAELEEAKLNLTRTSVIAPEDGVVINLTLRQGNYVNQGTSTLALIKKNSFYVTGYFEETKLPLVHVGQKAEVTLMNSNKPLEGHVVSVGRAIANSNTNANNQLLPQVQQTFNWVRLAQRIPVDITLDDIKQQEQLSAGMTVSIKLIDDK
ncbi:HlyD family secretion protein [Vibrio sp.]|nr:HlyD family secretion protein [Vibrio sp.]